MNRRCISKEPKKMRSYSSRGIKCLWKSFEEFRDDMYDSFLEHRDMYGEANTTIERIDVNGNYCKENCRWATLREQGNNRRTNRFVEYKGKKYSVTELARKFNKHRRFIFNRLRNRKIESVIEELERTGDKLFAD